MKSRSRGCRSRAEYRSRDGWCRTYEGRKKEVTVEKKEVSPAIVVIVFVGGGVGGSELDSVGDANTLQRAAPSRVASVALDWRWLLAGDWLIWLPCFTPAQIGSFLLASWLGAAAWLQSLPCTQPRHPAWAALLQWSWTSWLGQREYGGKARTLLAGMEKRNLIMPRVVALSKLTRALTIPRTAADRKNVKARWPSGLRRCVKVLFVKTSAVFGRGFESHSRQERISFLPSQPF